MQDNTQVMQMIYEQVKPIGIYNLPLKKRFSLSTSLTRENKQGIQSDGLFDPLMNCWGYARCWILGVESNPTLEKHVLWTRFCKYPKTNNGFQRKLLHSSPRKG
ncbi:hypothetical protein T06_15337 [Trichinella sp. T6]|nr:hypothetical protein T06_15337 [Trichinella sp. T6]